MTSRFQHCLWCRFVQQQVQEIPLLKAGSHCSHILPLPLANGPVSSLLLMLTQALGQQRTELDNWTDPSLTWFTTHLYKEFVLVQGGNCQKKGCLFQQQQSSCWLTLLLWGTIQLPFAVILQDTAHMQFMSGPKKLWSSDWMTSSFWSIIRENCSELL